MPDAPSPETSPRRQVLLVEDNEATRLSLGRLLAAKGFDVRSASNGEEALEAIRNGPPTDFLLTDLRLPDLDGREVAREARVIQPYIRIALITGWDLATDLGKPESWGLDGILTKPLDIQELFQFLGRPEA